MHGTNMKIVVGVPVLLLLLVISFITNNNNNNTGTPTTIVMFVPRINDLYNYNPARCPVWV